MARRKKFGDRAMIEPVTNGQTNPTHWIATLSFPAGKIMLGATEDGLQWTTDSKDEGVKSKAAWATYRVNFPLYEYSPSDGPVGYLAAHLVANELGGALELAPVSELPDELVPTTGDPDAAVENEDLDTVWVRNAAADDEEDRLMEEARERADFDLDRRRDAEDADYETRLEELEEMLRAAEEANTDPLTTNRRVDEIQGRMLEMGQEMAQRYEERRQEDADRNARRALEDEATLLVRNERDAELERQEVEWLTEAENYPPAAPTRPTQAPVQVVSPPYPYQPTMPLQQPLQPLQQPVVVNVAPPVIHFTPAPAAPMTIHLPPSQVVNQFRTSRPRPQPPQEPPVVNVTVEAPAPAPPPPPQEPPVVNVNVEAPVIPPFPALPEYPVQPAPVVNVTVEPSEAPAVFVEPPNVVVNVAPAEVAMTVPAPVVNVAPSVVNVEAPNVFVEATTVPAPNVVNKITVQPAEVVVPSPTVPAGPIEVILTQDKPIDVRMESVDKERVVKITRTADGKYEGTVTEE